MATFQELNTLWKMQKDGCKAAYELFSQKTKTVDVDNTTYILPKFPSFTKGMGKALESLHTLVTKKDVKDLQKHKDDKAKYKKSVTEAVTQYKSDVLSLTIVLQKIPKKYRDSDATKGYVEAAEKAVNNMGKLLISIEKELKEVK